MDTFADRLHALSRGAATIDDVLAAADRLLTQTAGDDRALLAALQAADAAYPLDPDVRTAIAQHVRTAAARMIAATGGPGAMAAAAGTDDDRTQIAAPAQRETGIGSVIKGRFELVELLGAGGMGKVFKAIDRVRVEAKDRQHFVAIKLLSEAFRQHEVSAIALQREAKKALGLSHPNIVRVYDFDRDGTTLFMTMEFLSGQSLDQTIKASGFAGMPLDRALQMLRPVAAALAYAHESGLVHSDFKPSNVFVTDEGQVKVIDFGIARAVKHGGDGGEQTAFDAGSLGALTLPYASPEQIAGLDPDPRDDIYALACVAYELLVGRHPFDRMSAAKARAQNKLPVKPDGLNAKQWEGLKRALDFDRAKRTPSVERFMQDLAPHAAATGGGGGKALVAIAAVGGVGIAAAGIAVWFFTQPSPPPEPVPTPPPIATATPQPPVTQPETTSPTSPTAVSPVTPPPPQPQPTTAFVPPTPPALDPHAVDAAIGGVPCSVLQATISDGAVTLTGHAYGEADLQALKDRLTGLGASNVSANVEPFKAFQCQPIDMVRGFIATNRGTGQGLGVASPKPGFRGGEKLKVDVAAGSRDGYVTVDYYDSGGDVLHMLPRPGNIDNFLRAGGKLRLGDGGRSGEWFVQKPFGQDLAVVLLTPEPLFTAPRADVESATTYLAALRQAIDRITARHGPNAVAAEFAIVTTRP